jgi:Zn-dependent peptidase ImmA (M78 family)
MRRPDAENKATEVLRRHNVTSIPVPIEQIAQAEGAQIVRQHFDGDQSGFVYQDGRLKIIGINSATSHRRQRFSIAHELGHMLMHQSDAVLVDRIVQIHNRDHTSSLAIDPVEIQANAFAAAALMPSEHVIQHVQDMLDLLGSVSRERLVADLAQTFDVSSEAMGYRLINLGVITN